MRVAVLVVELYVAETVAVTALVTPVVEFAVNVAVFAPAETVTLSGTTTSALSLSRSTTAPPVGAAAERVTVPVEFAPAVTNVGLKAMLDRFTDVAPLTVSVVDALAPL